MTSPNDGGPAFPFTPNPQPQSSDGTWVQQWDAGEQGMSLRDWFAGKALEGMYSNPALVDNFSGHTNMAKEAWLAADAMLTARKTKG